MAIDLGPLRDRWLTWCASFDLSPSEALRQLVRRLEPGRWPKAIEGAKPPLSASRLSGGVSGRFTVRFTAKELKAIGRRAAQEGMSVPRWVISVARAQVSGEPQLGDAALAVMSRSAVQVRSIGRNLNQLTRALNEIALHIREGRQDEAAKLLRQQSMSTVLKIATDAKNSIEAHMPKMEAVMTENALRWRAVPATGTKDGEGT